MKISIREGVFETNSSSAHTLVIKKDKYLKNNMFDDETFKNMIREELYLDENEDEIIIDDLHCDEYFDTYILTEPIEKTKYLINSIISYFDFDNNDVLKSVNDLINTIDSVCQVFTDIGFKVFISVPMGVDRILYNKNSDFKDIGGEDNFGYTNSEISDIFRQTFVDINILNFIKRKNISIKDFIFNKKYYILVGRDENDTIKKILSIANDSIDNIYGFNPGFDPF